MGEIEQLILISLTEDDGFHSEPLIPLEITVTPDDMFYEVTMVISRFSGFMLESLKHTFDIFRVGDHELILNTQNYGVYPNGEYVKVVLILTVNDEHVDG